VNGAELEVKRSGDQLIHISGSIRPIDWNLTGILLGQAYRLPVVL